MKAMRTFSAVALVTCIGPISSGCGASQPTDEFESALPMIENTATPQQVPVTSDDPTGAETDANGLNETQREQMKVALRRGGEKASECNKATGSNVSGEGEVQVTFDGKTGYSVDATVGPPFAGSPVEDCVKRAFIKEVIVPFDGKLTVPYTVKLGGKEAAAPDPKKPKK